MTSASNTRKSWALGALSALTLFLADCQRVDSGQDLSCPLSDLRRSELVIEEHSLQLGTEVYAGVSVKLRGWSLFAVEVYEPYERSASRTILYIPGGPRVPPISAGLIKQLTRLYDDGDTKIIVLSHSGNELSNLNGSERIERYGIGSVECDSEVAARFVRYQQSINKDSSIILHGNSYGSLLTLDLASHLGEDVEDVIIQAPWVFPASINNMLSISSPVFVNGQDGIELVDRASMEQDMRQLYSRFLRISDDASGSSIGERQIGDIRDRACKKVVQPILFLFGEYEDRSDVDRTVSYAQCFKGGATIVKVKSAPHGSELAVASAREKVHEFLRNED